MEQQPSTSAKSLFKKLAAELKSKTRSLPFLISCLVIGMIVILVIGYLLLIKDDEAAKAEKVRHQLTSSINNTIGRLDGIEIKFAPETGLASIEQTDQVNVPEGSSEQIRIAYTLLVKLGKQVLDIEEVKAIEITEKIKFNYPEDPNIMHLPPEDQKTRPPKEIHVVTIGMTKANFQSINWEQHKGQSINKLIAEKSYVYNINPDLKEQIEDSELYLDLR